MVTRDVTLRAFDVAERRAREQLACIDNAKTWARVIDWIQGQTGRNPYDTCADHLDAVLAHAVAMSLSRPGSAMRWAQRSSLDAACDELAKALIAEVAEGLQRKVEAELLAKMAADQAEQDAHDAWLTEPSVLDESVRRAER